MNAPGESYDLENTLNFIRRYRLMETSSNAYSENFLRAVFPLHQVDHLCDSWRGRKKSFSSFFLNLSHAGQGRILKGWGIPVNHFDEYLQKIEDNLSASIFLTAPNDILWYHGLILYFGNHGIGDVGSIKLTSLPRSDYRYGNSANWGKYILSLSLNDQGVVIDALYEQVVVKKE